MSAPPLPEVAELRSRLIYYVGWLDARHAIGSSGNKAGKAQCEKVHALVRALRQEISRRESALAPTEAPATVLPRHPMTPHEPAPSQRAQIRVVPNKGGGECMFYALSQAFDGAGSGIRGGQGIAPMDLKRQLAMLVTQDEFLLQREAARAARAETPASSRGRRPRGSNAVADYASYEWILTCPDLAMYREMLGRPGVWGDGQALEHAEEFLQCRVLVLDVRTGRACYGRKEATPATLPDPPNGYVVLAWNGSHFELVVDDQGRRRFDTRQELPENFRRMFALGR